MNKEIISYSESMETVNEFGLKRWIKYSHEKEIENPTTESILEAKKYVTECVLLNLQNRLKVLYPHLYSNLEPLKVEVHPETEPITQVTRPKEQIAGMIYDIESVTELTVLKSYEVLCRNNTKLKEVYQSKLKELTNEF